MWEMTVGGSVWVEVTRVIETDDYSDAYTALIDIATALHPSSKGEWTVTEATEIDG